MAFLDKLQAWVSRHRTEVAIGVGVVVVGVAAAALLSGAAPADPVPSKADPVATPVTDTPQHAPAAKAGAAVAAAPASAEALPTTSTGARSPKLGAVGADHGHAHGSAHAHAHGGRHALPAPEGGGPFGLLAAPASTGGSGVGGGPRRIMSQRFGREVLDRDTLVQLLQEMAAKLESLQTMFPAEGEDSEAMFAEFQARVLAEVTNIEAEIRTKYKVEQSTLVASQAEHAEDPEVARLMQRVKNVFLGSDGEDADGEAGFGGGGGGGAGGGMDLEASLPEGMTADKFYDLFLRHMRYIDEAFTAVIAESVRVPRAERTDYLALMMSRRLSAINAQASAAIGMSEEEFQVCLRHYQSDPRFIMTLVDSQERQKRLADDAMRAPDPA